MKKMIALIAVCALLLTLAGCTGIGNSSGTKVDPDNVSDFDSYSSDFDGLKDYFKDLGLTDTNEHIDYDLVGADNGVRYLINNNAYIEVYDFSSLVDNSATSDSADPDKARSILDDVKENGRFKPMDNSVELTARLTKSGRFVIAWDASRSYKYEENIVTDDLLESDNW